MIDMPPCECRVCTELDGPVSRCERCGRRLIASIGIAHLNPATGSWCGGWADFDAERQRLRLEWLRESQDHTDSVIRQVRARLRP